MKRRLFALSLALCLAAPSWAQTVTGRVVGVSDGDTITVLDGDNRQHKVRLAYIDAPESGQAFGSVAKAALSVLVFGRTVTVQGQGTDRYGRTIGLVIGADGRQANLAMVASGLAWHDYFDDQPRADRERYEEAMAVARRAPRGLWVDESPVRPKDFRKSKRG